MLIDIMHILSSSLQGPVVVALIALVIVMVFVVGMLIAEFFTERRYFKLNVPQLVDDVRADSDVEKVVMESGMLRRQKNALVELLKHPSATPVERESMAVNIVAQEQTIYDNRVKATDLIAKIAPMLGLMGTLIPLGPGIVGIGEGDTEILAESLMVAFDTTVLGLVVAVVALAVSTLRKAWYAKYSAAFESAAECVLEAANNGAVAQMHADGATPKAANGAGASAAPASAAQQALASEVSAASHNAPSAAGGQAPAANQGGNA
ncbi:MAG: MotA/TolQ/ExbB proton channel family protein [Eggerthellaceae bacterium]|nr:MotA/TolQ/ExbB proton channel family protein [Eggerthellaceae bacterium]